MRVVRLLILGLSVLVGAAAVGLLFMIAGVPRTTIGWVWAALAFVLGFAIARTTLSMGLHTSSAFEQGAREAAAESRGDSFEATGRKAGAVVGRGLNKVARIGAPKTSPAPSPNAASTTADAASGEPGPVESQITDPEPAKPDVTVEKAARVIGSMVGRRVAQRRNKP